MPIDYEKTVSIPREAIGIGPDDTISDRCHTAYTYGDRKPKRIARCDRPRGHSGRCYGEEKT